jgi:hypothetical protein
LGFGILHWHKEANFSLSIAFCDSSCEHLQGADLTLPEGVGPSRKYLNDSDESLPID